jgi:alpha-ketoglutarate-dependent taurine dioxygenase
MLNDTILQKPSFKDRSVQSRKSISLQPEEIIRQSFLDGEKKLPLVIQPAIEGVNLIDWAKNNPEFLETNLLRYGGILFRGFGVNTTDDFQSFIQATSGSLLEYTYRSTPRKQVSGRVYTSTEYPQDMAIPMHNENSYSRNWAMKLFFLCVTAADEQGETPIADSRLMFERIDAEIRQKFIEKKVMYVRNYGSEIDLPWQNVFQTTSKREVEEFCQRSDIKFEWLGGDRLRTKQLCQSVAKHPQTGESIWFNQANLFHVGSLPSEVRNALLSNYGEENLPRNAYFGDGELIEASVIEHINGVYEQTAVNFPWQKGDVLMLDNMLTAHGRNPFKGQRKIVVGMAQPYNDQILTVD